MVGTDVFHAAVLLWAAGAAHFVSGNVDLVMAGSIMIGSIPGVWLGAHLSMRLPPAGLRPALGIVLLASGMGLLTKAGATIPVGVLVAAPLGLAVLAWALHVRRTRTARTPRPLPESAL